MVHARPAMSRMIGSIDMSELAEDFKFMREVKREKKQSNLENSISLLHKNGIEFDSFNGGTHLKVGDYDFWPSTGLFINRKTYERRRGIFTLIASIKAGL
jgi:hypothetical protein